VKAKKAPTFARVVETDDYFSLSIRGQRDSEVFATVSFLSIKLRLALLSLTTLMASLVSACPIVIVHLLMIIYRFNIIHSVSDGFVVAGFARERHEKRGRAFAMRIREDAKIAVWIEFEFRGSAPSRSKNFNKERTNRNKKPPAFLSVMCQRCTQIYTRTRAICGFMPAVFMIERKKECWIFYLHKPNVDASVE